MFWPLQSADISPSEHNNKSPRPAARLHSTPTRYSSTAASLPVAHFIRAIVNPALQSLLTAGRDGERQRQRHV